ncbi:hypothetical protein KAFR_0C03860 [Kazachstania africana CBS 2517]|uniref:DUF1748-domain-containing protein n=1 Tax=Kazachstania africana (strain ATCC 22294 / BCRC 22015 / CBS 2517 / CECT 1963 / NBRC 1671 / NRRL Y-8276) TaxID=1071382 RepID=H2ASM7_KAZAF|nr:hypothetical protein KAFR_0C03860 [Kazachstania africana CBS 2517]CCF57377.1 hypothetical protein KAFR_0C03860 [Kazachstania africana CBS 2517]
MSLKSIIHYGVDLSLIAMLLAGIRHQTGYVFAYERYDFARLIYGYLQWGETCYDKLVKYVKGSPRFRKQLKNVDDFSSELEEDINDYKKRKTDRFLPRR